MKEGWSYKKLGEVASYINGYAFKPEQWTTSGTPIVRIQNLNNSNAPFNYFSGDVPEKVKIKNGDLLISWSASLGAYIWQGGDAFLNQHIFKVDFNKLDINKMFLKYAVTSKLNVMAGLVHGATMKHIVKKDFDNTYIPFPSREEQEHIVVELDNINELIRLKDSQLKDFDLLAQSIFYDMFGDPISNPKGWEVKKIGDITEPTIGLTYKPENVTTGESGTIVLRSSNIRDSKLSFDDIVRVNIPIKEEKYVKDGDILMCSRNGSFNLVGKVAMIQQLKEPMSYGAFMTLIRSNYNPFLFGYFKTPAFREYLIQGKTTTVNQITVKMLKDIKLPLPPIPLQQDFAKKMETIEQQKAQIDSTIKELETLLASRMQYWFE